MFNARCFECKKEFSADKSNLITARKYDNVLEKQGDKRVHPKGFEPNGVTYLLCDECLIRRKVKRKNLHFITEKVGERIWHSCGFEVKVPVYKYYKADKNNDLILDENGNKIELHFKIKGVK